METIEINIDNYLTEEEKKEIIIDAYRERVRTELFRKPSGTALSDNEIQRIVGNDGAMKSSGLQSEKLSSYDNR